MDHATAAPRPRPYRGAATVARREIEDLRDLRMGHRDIAVALGYFRGVELSEGQVRSALEAWRGRPSGR